MSNEEKLEQTEVVEETKAEATADETTEEAHEEFEDVAREKGERKQRSRRKKIETQEEKPVSEWQERVVQIRRVTKVVKGGKKLSFRAVVIVGNQKGQVGVGCAKAAEVLIAIQKAIADGRKNLINVQIFKTTIPHPIKGVENILSKSQGSKSPLNAANATLDALQKLTPFSDVAKKRGLTMAELLN